MNFVFKLDPVGTFADHLQRSCHIRATLGLHRTDPPSRTTTRLKSTGMVVVFGYHYVSPSSPFLILHDIEHSHLLPSKQPLPRVDDSFDLHSVWSGYNHGRLRQITAGAPSCPVETVIGAFERDLRAQKNAFGSFAALVDEVLRRRERGDDPMSLSLLLLTGVTET
ncbi:uncharacterized protein EI90DRAFT_3288144 [Cantharellus anzutake]|uniref:uncharacterized protein n=1 Tax=Cantharellus anzutake TaxID=1750568 RepID=UPI001903B729|nr:uncharacterized protein EI90DRAFT_3288144 [Cantharellus anzutake]KAF8334653.1 hypothetical protein EI90DRAFT_3288144 [Cantharellus anzutake]